MFVPQHIRTAFDQLQTETDPLANLRSLELLAEWVADMRVYAASEAINNGYTLHRIGAVQNKTRQAVHRTLKLAQSPGLTDPEFDGVDSSTLRYWLDWWNDPSRAADGAEEKGRNPVAQAARIRAELEARFDAGILRKAPDGLKEVSSKG